MLTSDFIVIPSRNTELIHKVVTEYLTDEWVSHEGIIVKTYLHKSEQKTLLEFVTKPDNQIFVFLYECLSCEPEFYKDNYFGWFGLSDKVKPKSGYKDFGGKLANDQFKRRAIITPEMNEDFVVGYSDKGEKIEFHHSGDFSITLEKGYEKPNASYGQYERPVQLEFEPIKRKEPFNVTQWNWKMVLARLFLYPFCTFLLWFSISYLIPNGNYFLSIPLIAISLVYLMSDIYMVFKKKGVENNT